MQALAQERHDGFTEKLIGHKKHLMGYALHLSKDKDFADELVQITLCRAWQSRNDLQEPDYMKSWLSKILFREYVRIVSSHKYQNTLYIENSGDQEEIFHRQDSDKLPMDAEIDLRLFIEQIIKLPELYSLPLVHCAEGYNHQEIAKKLNITAATVLTRIHRARRIIKQRYCEYKQY